MPRVAPKPNSQPAQFSVARVRRKRGASRTLGNGELARIGIIRSEFFMRTVDQVPSLVPKFDVTVYLVLDHFGRLGSAYRETDEEQADLENVVTNLLYGEYNNPKRVIAF